MPASKATIEQVSREIRTIHAMLRRLARAVVQFAPAVAGAELEPGARVVGAGSLTLREQQVLRLIAAGKTSREIGRLFKISPRTVDSHRGSLMLKLGIHNTAGLVRYALQHPGAKQRRRRRLQSWSPWSRRWWSRRRRRRRRGQARPQRRSGSGAFASG